MMIDICDEIAGEIAITGNNSAHVQAALDAACRAGRKLYESQKRTLELENIIEKYDVSKALAAYDKIMEPKKLVNKANKSPIVKTSKTDKVIKLLEKNSMTGSELTESLGFETSSLLHSLRRSGLAVCDGENRKWELRDRNELIKIQ